VVALDTKRKKVWEFGEYLGEKTNNQAELSACIFLLQLILKSGMKEKKEMDKVGKTHNIEQKFEVRLDSQYVLKGATVWTKGWVKNGWKNSQKKDVENRQLWEQILYLKNEIEEHDIKILWSHVYGHTGEIWNDRVDEIARSFAAKKNVVLRKGEKYI
jgi:ribonuclease HI